MTRHDPDAHIEGAFLHRFLDGDLPAAEIARAERHLESCDGCRREVRRYRALFLDLATLPMALPPVDFDARILAAVLPAPAPDAVLLRLAARGYLAVTLFLVGFVGTLFVSAAAKSGSVEGTTASGLSKLLDSALGTLAGFGEAALGALLSVGAAAAPVATSLYPVANGLASAADAVAPVFAPVLVVVTALATAMLFWAVQTPQERRIPHGTLSL